MIRCTQWSIKTQSTLFSKSVRSMIISSKRKLKEPVIKHCAIYTKNVTKASKPIVSASLEMFFRLISMRQIVFSRNWSFVKNLSIEFREIMLKRCKIWMPEKDSSGSISFSRNWKLIRPNRSFREPGESWLNWPIQSWKTNRTYVLQIDINQVMLNIWRELNIDTDQTLMIGWAYLGTTLKYWNF